MGELIPFNRKYVQSKDKTFKEVAEALEVSLFTCECGSQQFYLYETGDVQCADCEEFVQVGCYIEED